MIELELTEEELDEQLHLCSICCTPLRHVTESAKLDDPTGPSILVCRWSVPEDHFGTNLPPIPTECLGLDWVVKRRRDRSYLRKMVETERTFHDD
jgi:hypothetical protein